VWQSGAGAWSYSRDAPAEPADRHVPVIDHGAVIGVLSIGELLKFRLDEKIQQTAVLQDLARAARLAA
jgi:hypothetical protein